MEEYYDNLKSYLSDARCCKQVTMQDFDLAINGILRKMGCSSVPVNHVIAAWAENRSIKWYLGILEKESDEGLLVL